MRRLPRLVFALALAAAGCGDDSSRAPGFRPAPPPPPPPASPAASPIAAVEEGTVSLARNFYFVLDGSGSMGEDPSTRCAAGAGGSRFPTKIDAARWAIRQFLEKVPAEDLLGLYVFDRNGQREVVPLAVGNRDAFLHAVDAVGVGGGTPLAEAIVFGVERLTAARRRQLGYGDFRLVVVTDGEATGRRLEDGTDAALRDRIPIYTIGFCVGSNHSLFRHSVTYRAANSAEQLRRGLEETLGELESFDIRAFGGS